MSEATIPIQVEDLRAKASRELESVPDLDGLEAWRITYTGRRGQLTQLLRGLHCPRRSVERRVLRPTPSGPLWKKASPSVKTS